MEEKQKKTGERSSFAMTCSLLSQFLKDNRSFGDRGIEKLHCSLEKEKDVFRPPTTMNLFPGSDASAENRSDLDLSEQNATISMDPSPQLQNTDAAVLQPVNRGDQKDNETNAQLTIFYDGKVMVFDNFPAKKAQDLMAMASKSVLPNSGPAPALQPEPTAPVDLTMPLARRASLHRFLAKRMDRINSQAPYLVHGSSAREEGAAKSEKSVALAWLGLGRQPGFNFDLKR